MARSILTAVKALGDKVERLSAQRNRLRDENKALRQEMEELRERARQAEEDRRQALLQIEFLTFSHKLADNPQKLADARRHVAHLIRILDRCISLLRDDPKL